jgi:hypothetical protein
MLDPILNRRVKESGRKITKRKNDEVKFDRNLKNAKIKYVNNYKRSRKCEICGETSPCCLEFHHIDKRKKLFTISSAICNIKIDMKTLRAEIRKCIILCSNCHKKLHYQDINVDILPEILNI